MKNFKKARGFTLVELLVYMGIFSFLLIVLTQMFTTIINVSLDTQSTSAVDQNNRFIQNRLTYDIQRAETLTTPALLGPSGQGSTMILNIGGTNYMYTQSGSTLLLTVNGVGQSLSNYNAKTSNLYFQRIGNISGVPAVKISYTLTSLSQSSVGPEVLNIQTVISLRPH